MIDLFKQLVNVASELSWKEVLDLSLAIALHGLAVGSVAALLGFVAQLLGPIGAGAVGAVVGAILGYAGWIFGTKLEGTQDYLILQ